VGKKQNYGLAKELEKKARAKRYLKEVEKSKDLKTETAHV